MRCDRYIIIAGFIAGTLDALAAIFFFTPAITMENINKIFEAIASVNRQLSTNIIPIRACAF